MIRKTWQRFVFLKFFDALAFLFFSPVCGIRKIFKKKRMPNGEIKKILVLELWGIGDLVMLSSALRGLRTAFPDSKIILCAKSFAREVFRYDQLIDGFVDFDCPWTRYQGKYKFWQWDWKGVIHVIRNLRKEGFDVVLDARGDFRNNFLSLLTGGKIRLGYDWTGGGYFLTDLLHLDYTNAHRVDAWANLLNYFDIKVNERQPRLCISLDENEKAIHFLKNNGIKENDLLIGIHPGARNKQRCWPLERFAETAEYFRTPVQ